MTTFRISWILYITGSLLVFGSWINVVPTGLAWFGWLAALGGWAMGAAEKRQADSRSKADEITKLNLLLKEGVVTEEEFQQEKAKLLREP